jgi:hypothetical protein
MAKKPRVIRTFEGKEYIYTGSAHSTKPGAKKRAKQIRNSKTHPANARVIPAKRKGKKRVYKIYQRPKGLKKKKI